MSAETCSCFQILLFSFFTILVIIFATQYHFPRVDSHHTTSKSLNIGENCFTSRISEYVKEKDDLLNWNTKQFKPFSDMFNVTFLLKRNKPETTLEKLSKGKLYIIESSPCAMAKVHHLYNITHVLLLPHLTTNWGGFSGPFPNRTIDWSDLYEAWRNSNCFKEDVQKYLDSPFVKLVITTQHQQMTHPKILSIPLGIRLGDIPLEEIFERVRERQNRTRLLLINNSGWNFRSDINNQVIKNFQGSIQNEYSHKGDGVRRYIQQVKQSKFILTPPGLGVDSFRIWESLLLGAIPICENSAVSKGWKQCLDELPVLWVDDYAEVIPALLKREYPKLLQKCYDFEFRRMNRFYWRGWVLKHAYSRRLLSLTEMHEMSSLLRR